MNKKIVWIAVSCLMVVSLLVTSCGDGVTDEEEDINGEEEDINGEVEEEEEEEEEVVDDDKDMVVNTAGKLVERPRYGGEYHLSRTSDIRGFDDVLPSSPQYMTNTLSLTHDELYTGDWARGPQGTGEAGWNLNYGPYFPHLEVPCLATGYEMPDDETIIWHIRQGIHFQDKPPANGRELNAHDIVYNLRRAYWTEGSFLYNTYREDRGESPSSIEAIDDWTVEMKVPPARQIPLLFATNDYIAIQCPEAIEQYGDANTVESCIGTGAFIWTDYVAVSSITFERNPDYWMTNPLHPEDQLPYIDGVKIFVIPDTSTALAAFRTGKIETRSITETDEWQDMLHTNPELSWKRIQPTGCATIWMRLDKPELPYDDIRVRQALYYAIDHQAIIDDYYNGEAEMITAPVAQIPEFEGWWTPLEEYSEDIQKLFGYYPDEAIELLADAGYPDGFNCTVLASSEGLLPIVKDNWAKVNVNAEIEIKTSPVVSSITMRGQHEDMYYGGESGEVVLKCHFWRTDSYLNYSMIDNAEFNEWFKEFELSMLDWDKMGNMMKEMEPKMRAQAYCIRFPAPYRYYMWWPWLKSWSGETNPGYYNVYKQMNYMWIDTELREELTGLTR
ncbi:MAG: ABC transporter substrate-binding protein [Dehalococcoidales bacterium]|nr:MAG: ABC transporter substrate-binding protein [Dehalococcoidales bacterium]